MPDRFQPLAVVGVSALFAGSQNAHGFWRDILAGRDLIEDVPPQRWLIDDHYDPDRRAPDKTYCKRGSFLGDVDFDPVEFGIPPSAISATDTCQLLALIVAKQVLDDALGGQFHSINRERASVILGVTSGQELFLEVASRLQAPVWRKALRESGIPEDKVREICDRIAGSYVPWQENTFPGLLGNVVAGRIANRFDLGGTNCVTDAACASSLSALTMAAAQLQLGQSDLVITGGADTFNDVSMFVCFSKTPALSPSGDCRPFSDNADGTVLGEGLAMIALRRLEDAEKDGNRIYAVIRGIGSSSDGRSKSIYAPLPEGQAKAMRRAYESAGYGPETVELVEAHGTGTLAGDASEISSMRSVFEESGCGRTQWCALGSVKSQIGHTKATAGAAGLFKTVMALHHKILPPTIKVDRPNADVGFEDSPFYVNTQARPWVRRAEHPRRASVSAFGFGGTNFHVTLEEHASGNPPDLRWTAPSELVLVSAGSHRELIQYCRNMADAAEQQSLAEAAQKSQNSFDASAAERLALICESNEDFRRKLHTFVNAEAPAPGVYRGNGHTQGRIAFLFPGQGSQYVGMAGDQAMAFEDCLAAWDAVPSSAKFVFPPPAFSTGDREAQAKRLAATENAQPAIATASASLLAILRRLGVAPDCVGGHSFGEITALFAAGAIDFDTMIRIARRRGELMAGASSVQGSMLSVSLDAAALEDRLKEWQIDLVLANRNSPHQSILSGRRAEIDEAARLCLREKIEATSIPVSTAFHSPLVQGTVEPLLRFLETCAIEPSASPVYSNLDGGIFPQDESLVRKRIARQVAEPVLFQRMIEQMYEDGVRIFVEVGPGSVLTSLVGSILTSRSYSAISLDKQRMHGVTALWHGLGQMAALGISMDWRAFRKRHQVETAPAQSGERFTVRINGGNYGRPYPPAGGVADLPQPITAPLAPVSVSSAPVQSATRTPSAAELGNAYKIFQESISEAHRNWQATLARGHESFLRAMESAYTVTMTPLGATPPVPRSPEALVASVDLPAPSPARAVIFEKAAVPAPAVDVDVQELLWSTVASATGYPAEMLEPRMSLEADLGIDGIKRVEILSHLQERMAGTSDIEPTRLAELGTLGEIVEYLQGRSKPQRVDVAGLVLKEIAEKTGYPVEMLNRDMSLEADLGIDSIKRVEIFSALQENFRGMAAIDTASLADLQTIANVIDIFEAPGKASVRTAARNETAPAQRGAVIEIESPPAGHRTIDISDGYVAVVGGGDVGVILAQSFRERGYEAEAMDVFSPGARVVISLTGLDRNADTNWNALRTAQLLAPRFDREGGVLVFVHDTEMPTSAGSAGLAKTASLEWPRVRTKSIGVASGDRDPATLASALLHELIAGGPEVEVTLKAHGRRHTPIISHATTGMRPRIDSQSVIIVSGGSRGITAACIIALARRTRSRFLLLGRTDPEALSVRDTLQALNEAGALARFTQADVRNREAVFQALEAIRQEWGPVTGIVHGAGVLADRRLDQLTRNQFDDVYSTKVDGLRTLIDATENEPVNLLCVFSSIAARYGNAGQAAYAMANESINHLARAEASRRGGQTVVKVIDWGPWEGGMVTPELARRFAGLGIAPLPMDQGAAAFVEELIDSPANEIEVIRGSTPPSAPRELRVRIDQRSHPFLADHSIQDVPVLPAVEALELFLRCAAVQDHPAVRLTCSNLKVLRGVRLDGFYTTGNLLFIRPQGEGVYEMTSADGTPHYEATLLPESHSDTTSAGLSVSGPLHNPQWTIDQIYGKLLFHGPAFQVIQEVSGVSSEGILGVVTGTSERQWRDGFRRSDAAMLDGGLQLARLWGFHSLGKLTLPARIGEIRMEPAGAEEAAMHCHVKGRTAGNNKIVCDVRFTSPSGQVVATMRDVEMYAAGN